MIKGIYPTGRYTTVSGGQPGSTSMYYSNHNSGQSSGPQSFSGQVRYNLSNQCMEVFDGNMWQMVGSSFASIGLTQEAEELLDWAKQKRQEEVNLKMRMEEHPGLKDAYEKFQVMDVLTKNNDS